MSYAYAVICRLIMEFKCFDNWDQLPHNSNALFTQAEKNSLFFSRLWFENLAKTALVNDERMLLICVIENDKALAILPLIKRNDKNWSSLSHIYTSLFTLLLVENNQQEILSCLTKGLRKLPFESLELNPIAADDKNINNLRKNLESSGFSCMRYAQFINWFHPLKSLTFTDYMDARPSRVRNTIARKQRKLAREHNYEIRLHTGIDVPLAMKEFHIVYKASWKNNEQFQYVMEGFVTSFSKLGWTRLAILYIEGQPIAAQIWFVVHKKASIFKLAYDEKWKQYSTGSILTHHLMKYVIDTDKVNEIDFLTGNDRYKKEWMSERRQRWRMVCTRDLEHKQKVNPFIKLIRKWL